MVQLTVIRNTPPPILNKKVPDWIFQTPAEMFEKTKKGSKNYRFVLRQNKTKIHSTHWGVSLNDNTITHLEVNKKLNWLKNSELSQDIVDRHQRLLYRKTQFNDQLSKYPQSGVTSNNCEYCLLHEKKNIKEVASHCLFYCPKIQGIYDHVVTSLNLQHLIPLPTTPKRTLIWDENNAAKNLSNAIFTIVANEILRNRSSMDKLDFDKIKLTVKSEIIASINAYSNKNLSREIGRLGLVDFLASKPVTGI